MIPKIGTLFTSFAIKFMFFTLCESASRSFNCSSTNTKNFPSVSIYDAADDIPDYKNEGTVLLSTPLGVRDIVGYVGLECKHTAAIRWVYDLNFAASTIEDTYSQTRRKVDIEDFDSPEKYSFEADVELKVHGDGMDFVLMCMSTKNPCERRIVRVTYSTTVGRYMLTLLEMSEENIELVKEMDTALYNKQKMNRVTSGESCAMNFSLVDFGDKFAHLFIPNKGSEKPRDVPDRQNLENAYLTAKTLSPSCITNQCELPKVNCNLVVKNFTRKYRPIVFYAQHRNISGVVFAYHTLVTRNSTNDAENKPGRLKFAWQKPNKQDMMTMDELPSKVYMGESLDVKCNLSPFLFSVGTLVGYRINSPSSSMNNSLVLETTEEDPDFDAYMEAKGSLVINPEEDEEYNATVYCFAPIWDSSTEWVNVSKTIKILATNISEVSSIRRVHIVKLNSTFTTICNVSGRPVPLLNVTTPRNNPEVNITVISEDDYATATIHIVNLDDTHVGFYNCVATNLEGVQYYDFEIRLETTETSNFLELSIISGLGFVVFIFLVLVIIFFLRLRLEKAEFRKLTEEAVEEFLHGVDSAHVKLTPNDNADSEEAIEHYVNDSVKMLPYERKYEVPHKHWTFTDEHLGSGAFGLVTKGEVEVGSRKSVIAIKTLKSTESIEDFRASLLELKIMAHIGHHQNIVKLVAASTEEIRNRMVLIGVEFCANGSLLSYIQKRKKLFNNLVKEGRIQFNKPQNDNFEQDGIYTNLVTSDISTTDLFNWAFQLASGMNFLESMNICHADVAARNILLDDHLVVKISDFGLSRELYENSEYTKKTRVVLPWKWMAIESLKYLKFSSKSDVWSYGVTLYELFTLGEEPYPGQAWTEEFMNLLDNGMRLGQPKLCTDNVYNQVMMPCWQKEPKERIGFADAMSFFEKAIGLLTSMKRNEDECREFC